MPRRLILAGIWVVAFALVWLIADHAIADARVKPPKRAQVEDAIHDAIEIELLDTYHQPANIYPHCIRGSRGDRTRLVRWFCIVRTYSPNGDLIYRSRLRARAHRGSVATTVNYWGEGLIDMAPRPRGWYLTTSTLAKKKASARRADPVTGLDGSYVANRVGPILDRVAKQNHRGRVALTTFGCVGSAVIPVASCTLRVWGPRRRHKRRVLIERVGIIVTRVAYHRPIVFEDYSGWVTTRQPDGKRRSLTLDPEA